MGVSLHTPGTAAHVSTVVASPPPANLVERARTVALEQRLEAAESRAAALEERLTACH
jgi:hypothetical protein